MTTRKPLAAAPSNDNERAAVPRTGSHCPKCGRVRGAGASACDRCGLIFSRWNAASSTATVPIDAQGEALWRDVLDDWSNTARHDAFVKHCSAQGSLASAGRRYREALDARPDDAVARRMQERVVGMATVVLTARAPAPAPVTRRRWFWALTGLSFVLGMVGALVRSCSGGR